MGDRIPPVDDREIINEPVPHQEVLPRGSMSRASDFLQENSRIGMLRTHYDKYRRYVTLNLATLFTQLFDLYLPLFQTQWPRFKRYMESFELPPGIPNAWSHATRAYISAWIHDLYVSNREAVKKLSPLAFRQHYMHEEVYYSIEYDEFLTRTNAAIRPTNIRGTPEDTLYIPILCEEIDWSSDNPFALLHYTNNYHLVCGLIGIMKDTKAWKVNTLITNTVGRPAWLFDWHANDKVCAWFPPEGNYNLEDVTMAYIIGAACTPKIGPRDVDDWQDFPGGVIPQRIILSQLERATDRRFFGAYEVRTIDQRTSTGPPTIRVSRAREAARRDRGKSAASKTRSTTSEPDQTETETEESTEIVATTAQFQIQDWTYYHLVVLNLDPHTRSGALRTIVFN